MMGIKVLLLGAAGVGKTSFLHRITSAEFQRKYIPTVGVSISSWNGLDFWDFSGQEKLGVVQPDDFTDASVALIVTENNQLSMDVASQYVAQVQAYAPTAQMILVVNDKVGDLPATQGQVNPGLPYVVVSVKTGQGCQQVLDRIIVA